MIVEPNILYLMLMAHLFFYASYFFTNWSATYFQEGRGLSEEDTKKFISLSYFLGAMGCLIGGFLSDWLVKKRGLRFGRRVVAGVGLGVSALLFLLAGLTSDNQLAGYLIGGMCILKGFGVTGGIRDLRGYWETKLRNGYGHDEFCWTAGWFFYHHYLRNHR